MATGGSDWLQRRTELLKRAIVELEQHLERPHLDPGLNPDVKGSLDWARAELARIRLREGFPRGDFLSFAQTLQLRGLTARAQL